MSNFKRLFTRIQLWDPKLDISITFKGERRSLWHSVPFAYRGLRFLCSFYPVTLVYSLSLSCIPAPTEGPILPTALAFTKICSLSGDQARKFVFSSPKASERYLDTFAPIIDLG